MVPGGNGRQCHKIDRAALNASVTAITARSVAVALRIMPLLDATGLFSHAF